MIRESNACVTVETSVGVSMDASRNSELASQGFVIPVAVVIGDALADWSGVAAPLTPSVDGWLPPPRGVTARDVVGLPGKSRPALRTRRRFE